MNKMNIEIELWTSCCIVAVVIENTHNDIELHARNIIKRSSLQKYKLDCIN
jgi:hypothetical protein